MLGDTAPTDRPLTTQDVFAIDTAPLLGMEPAPMGTEGALLMIKGI